MLSFFDQGKKEGNQAVYMLTYLIKSGIYIYSYMYVMIIAMLLIYSRSQIHGSVIIELYHVDTS